MEKKPFNITTMLDSINGRQTAAAIATNCIENSVDFKVTHYKQAGSICITAFVTEEEYVALKKRIKAELNITV